MSDPKEKEEPPGPQRQPRQPPPDVKAEPTAGTSRIRASRGLRVGVRGVGRGLLVLAVPIAAWSAWFHPAWIAPIAERLRPEWVTEGGALDWGEAASACRPCRACVATSPAVAPSEVAGRSGCKGWGCGRQGPRRAGGHLPQDVCPGCCWCRCCGSPVLHVPSKRGSEGQANHRAICEGRRAARNLGRRKACRSPRGNLRPGAYRQQLADRLQNNHGSADSVRPEVSAAEAVPWYRVTRICRYDEASR